MTCKCHMRVDDPIPILGIRPVCEEQKCECDALASGSCASPRNIEACKAEVASAINNCVIGDKTIADWRNETILPESIIDEYLTAHDYICTLFNREGCSFDFQGDFCVRRDFFTNPAIDDPYGYECFQLCRDAQRLVSAGFSPPDRCVPSSEFTTDQAQVLTIGKNLACTATCVKEECDSWYDLASCNFVSISTAEQDRQTCLDRALGRADCLTSSDCSACPVEEKCEGGYESLLGPFCRVPDAGMQALPAS